jgi:hypothetical protein
MYAHNDFAGVWTANHVAEVPMLGRRDWKAARTAGFRWCCFRCLAWHKCNPGCTEAGHGLVHLGFCSVLSWLPI